MLPISLRLVYALNSATFQISSLALLSIVNTRVSIPAEYLPAYGAISFLPYSLRPIFAWLSSLLLKLNDAKAMTTKENENRNRHDKLLFPAFLLASLSFVGTIFIPSGGIIVCFFWGFMRGIAGAWSDFLIGMSVIEFSKLQVRFPSPNEGVASTDTYQHVVSVNTAQSSVAKNIGSFLASIATFAFFAKHRNLGETVANTLLLGTAATFLLASLVSLKFQFHVGNLVANLKVQRYNTVDNDANEEQHANDATSSDSLTINGMHYSSSSASLQESSLSERSGSDTVQSYDSEDSTLLPAVEDVTEPNNNTQHRRQIVEVSTLVAFQILLAVSALQKPIIAISNQTTWVSLVATFIILLIFVIILGYRYENQDKPDPLLSTSSAPRSSSGEEGGKPHSQSHRLPHRQLNMYFLLRYSMPIAGFLMYSYLYSVFEKEPQFLQLLSVLKTAIGILATFSYEFFLSPYCHSGWPLIGLIASLDIIMGLVALLDVWVIRAVRGKEVDGEYTVDIPLRFLVIAVGLAKYFFAELDYMPALVLSTTNVYSDDDDALTPVPKADNVIGELQLAERTSLSDEFARSNIASLSIDLNNNEDEEAFDIVRPPRERSAAKLPVISAGLQYASFLSCIDFGAQIGDWITIPIIASLDITRENHWDHLEKLIMICSIFRMTRVVFLWLICPPIQPQHKANSTDYNDYSNVNDES